MRVGIVGAGITGLALTHHLAARGIDSIALEAGDEPGGVIRSEPVEGVLTERGPQRVRRTPPIDALIDACDLDEPTVESEELPLYVYAGGDLGEVPFDLGTFARTDLLSLRGKLRLLAEPVTRAGTPQESIETVFRRKFGAEAYRNVFGPLYGGIYGSDPAAMPARHALSGLLEAEAELHSLLRAFLRRVGGGRQFPPISFEGGLQALPEALADRYSERVRLGTPATGLAPADGTGGRSAPGWHVETPDGTETVDRVVVTASAPAAADLLEEVTGAADGGPGADDAVAGLDALRELTYNPLALVYLQSDFDGRGLGYQVGYGEDLHTLGVSWNAAMFDRDGLYTAFLGGMHDPEILEESDERLGEIAVAEFEEVAGASASVLGVHRLEQGFPAWDGSWDALDGLETPAGIDLATNYTARMGVPSRVREAAEIAARIGDGV